MREQFPGLDPTWHRFDGPAGTLVHAAVRDAIADYLGSGDVANDHGAFAASRRSEEIVDWAAGRIHALLGAPTGCLVFGPNMTTLTTMFVRSVGASLRPGDEIVCTELDHEANRAPWFAVGEATGARVREARMTPSGGLPSSEVLAQLGPRTRWVAVTAASNALGVTPDLPAIVAGAHAVGARVVVDGVQAVAHHPIDLAAIGCDAFVTASYKWYGPHAGVLWLSDEVAATASLPEQVPSAASDLPDRLQLGTTNFEAVLGAGVAADVLARTDRRVTLARERELLTTLLARLRAEPAVRILGPGDAAGSPLVTFQVEGMTAEEVATRLAARRVAVTHGSFYASAALRAVAPERPEAVRAGIAWYTDETDVRALADAVAALDAGA
jgi:selenocysteine lyase/cysteine desulfurase